MNSRSSYVGLAMICFTFGFVGNAHAEEIDTFKGEKGTLKISGGTAHIPVLKVVMNRIKSVNPDIQISIAGGGSSMGIKQVGEGLVDIGNSGRKPTNEEIEKYNLKLFKWAIDGIGVIVHPSNKLTSLTTAQVQAVYSGEIDNWKQLGGEDKHIEVYTRHEGSGTRKVFWQKALNKGEVIDGATTVESHGAMIHAISRAPYGIGYVSVGYIDDSIAPVALNGVMPTPANVEQGKYEIARGLYSSTKGDPSGLTKKFIEYLFKQEAQDIVTEKGLIPIK